MECAKLGNHKIFFINAGKAVEKVKTQSNPTNNYTF